MNYVYLLHSQKDNQLYVGCTNDLNRRVKEHNSQKVYATKQRIPLVLVHYEAFINNSDAFAREHWFKTGWGRNHMKKMLFNTLKNLGGQV